MPAQVTREAIDALSKECRSVNATTLSNAILDRLETENPGYAHITNIFACTIRASMGKRGYELARDVAALCYRTLELSERNPQSTPLLKNVLANDPLTAATGAEFAASLALANECIARWSKPLE